MPHPEPHKAHRTGWLRAAVLGANDGIISTASLISGVAAAGSTQQSILLAGIAGLVAGAMSMAAGEYVSVSSQADTEKADLAIEQRALDEDLDGEKEELAEIYEGRGLEPSLARQVAEQLMAHDALGAHARDEIGISDSGRARPVQAAIASAVTFTVGAAVPLLVAWGTPNSKLSWMLPLCSFLCLAMLGGVAARAGGASVFKGAARVTLLGAIAMGLTAGIGGLFGTTV